MTPRWVLRPFVDAIHDQQLAEHRGAAGLRNPALVESALSRPQIYPSGSQHKHGSIVISHTLGGSTTAYVQFFVMEITCLSDDDDGAVVTVPHRMGRGHGDRPRLVLASARQHRPP